MRLIALFCLVLGSVSFATAEIEKTSILTNKGLQLYWWPKLKIPTGWTRYEDVSHENGCNMLGPTGSSFDVAPAIIYSRAFYLPNRKARGTVQEFIESDLKEMRQDAPGSVARELEKTSIKNGKLRTYSVINAGKTYEQVCYGIEGKYRILFCLSAKSEAALKRALPLFKAMLAAYK